MMNKRGISYRSDKVNIPIPKALLFEVFGTVIEWRTTVPNTSINQRQPFDALESSTHKSTGKPLPSNEVLRIVSSRALRILINRSGSQQLMSTTIGH